MWGERLEVSPEMVKGWVEQAWTVWKGRKGLILVKIWQLRIRQLE